MRIGLAIVVGALAELSGVALTATATWLIMRAAEQPPMSALTVAIVAVRALAMARGGLRYAERLTGHSAVLRHAAELRGRVYDSLLRRKNIPSGDALTQLVSDVDEKPERAVALSDPCRRGGPGEPGGDRRGDLVATHHRPAAHRCRSPTRLSRTGE